MTTRAGHRRFAPRWGLPIPETLVLIAVALLAAYQLFVPPIRGMADNGDFDRVLEPLGLTPVATAWADRYFGYVNTDYVATPRQPMIVFSTALVLGEIAKGISAPFHRSGTFPLGALALVHLALYLVGLYLLLAASRCLRGAPRVVIAIVVLLAAPDVAYIDMFNSFYTESASLLFLVLVIGIALTRIVSERPPSWTLPAYFVCAALFVAAKPQNYVLAIPLAALAVWVIAHSPRGRPTRGGLAVALGLIVVMAGLQAHLPHRFRSPVLWDTVFFSILGSSSEPLSDLQAFGLDSALVRYQGVPAWAGDISTPHMEVTRHLGFGKIARYYLTHPARTAQIASRCAGAVFRWHDPLIGNFTKTSGRPPRALAESFTGWSEMERRLFPDSLAFLLPFFFVVTGVAWWRRVVATAPRDRALAGLTLVLVVMAALEFAVVAAFSGMKDVTKHLYLFQVLFDVCLAAALAWAAARVTSLVRGGAGRPAVEHVEAG